MHSCTTSRMQPMSFAGVAKLMKSQVGWHLRDPQHQLRVASLIEASTNSALYLKSRGPGESADCTVLTKRHLTDKMCNLVLYRWRHAVIASGVAEE